jgi:hypothetical protein
MNNKKFKFQLNGMTFELPTKHIQTTKWNGEKLEKPIIRMNQTATAAVVKQYVKKMYPEVVVSATSDSFANGNSVSIYISDEYGAEVSPAIISDVHSFGSQFVYGKFNGMEDMYEYHASDGKTDGGTKIDAGTKYLHVQNKPKFCSLPDVYRMLIEMTTTEKYVFGMISIEKAIEQVKGYGATESNINKALKMLA